jgi:hypothetical protein
MKPITTNRILSQERSHCDGHGGVIGLNHFCAAGFLPRPRILKISPVHLIRKFSAAPKRPAGLWNASNKLHRNRTSAACRWRSPARTTASRREPLAGRKRFHRSEFIGLERSRQRDLSG